MTEVAKSPADGPISHENWHNARAGKPRIGGNEVPFFTDASIIGEIAEGFGPYQLLNTMALVTPGSGAPAVVLRTWFHLEGTSPDWKKGTDVERFHGGGLALQRYVCR